MIKYEFYPKQFRAATAHLTDSEELAFRKVIDMYIENYCDFDYEIDFICRKTKSQKKEIESILNEFFYLSDDDGWIMKVQDFVAFRVSRQ